MNHRIEFAFACGFLYNPRMQEVLLHLRDGNTDRNPHKWSVFGGERVGNETAIECCRRELKGEIDYRPSEDNIVFLMKYAHPRGETHIAFYSVADLPKDAFVLSEWVNFDWHPLETVDQLDLTDQTRAILRQFRHKFKR